MATISRRGAKTEAGMEVDALSAALLKLVTDYSGVVKPESSRSGIDLQMEKYRI